MRLLSVESERHGYHSASPVQVDRAIERYLFDVKKGRSRPTVWRRSLQSVYYTFTGVDVSDMETISELLIMVADVTENGAHTR